MLIIDDLIKPLKGYVARDKDGTLYFFQENKPYREAGGVWYENSPALGGCEISPELYPELTWKDEPVEAELAVTSSAKTMINISIKTEIQ